ncbi:MAG: glycosyltransferase family 2 protein [Candidatus Acidiferrales bacterium]
MARPIFSVLIDTYNHERFIEQAIRSAVEQDFPASDREILVVDDGSQDRTPEIVARFAPQVRLIRKANGGQASAFNAGIPKCQGEIIAFLDGDDWWAPNKLRLVAAAFSENPEVGLIGQSITEVLADGTHRSELVREFPRFRVDSVAGARLFRLRKAFLGTSRMAFRAEILRRIGPVPASLTIQADEFLFTLGALFSEVLLLREPLTFYRLHGQNLFQVSDGSVTALRRKHAVLLALADSLRRRFAEENVSKEISKTVIEAVQTEADALQLCLGGGTPLDTIRTEFRTYRIDHEHASAFRWTLKLLSLLPALFLSPRQFTKWKQKLASNSLYRKTRQRLIPDLRPTHVDRSGDWSRR